LNDAENEIENVYGDCSLFNSEEIKFAPNGQATFSGEME
jgi:hypothetical protein